MNDNMAGNYPEGRSLLQAIIDRLEISRRQLSGYQSPLFIGRRKWFPSHRQLIAPSPPHS